MNVLSILRSVPEIVNIYCATANPIEILYIETDQGRGIIGIVDGYKPKGIEDEDKYFLKHIYIVLTKLNQIDITIFVDRTIKNTDKKCF